MRYIYTLLLTLLLFPITGNSQINHLKHGDKLHDKYDYIDAQEVYKKVVERGHTSAQIYSDLGDSYYFQSDYKEAAVWYQRLLSEYPEEVEKAHYLRAIQSFKSNQDYSRAEEVLQTYTFKYGDSPIAKQYEQDPDYLQSLKEIESEYLIKELHINVEGSDHSPAFYGKNQIVFSSPAIEHIRNTHDWDGGTFLDLFIADRDTLDGWLGNKRPIQGNVNTKLHESAAVFTKDGNTMYFTRNNIVDGKKRKDKEDVIRLKIFKATYQGKDTWQVVEDLPINDDSFSTAYPALNAAEDKLYFSSDREGTLGMSDIWYVDLHDDGSYGEPVHLGNTINTEAREAFLFIDENDVLYFSSDGHLGMGGLDIFKTQLDAEGKPGAIENLGAPFNSPQDDFALIIEPEKEMGYFTSNREDAKSINDDLYYFYKECKILLEGILKDKQTQAPLAGGTVKLLDSDNGLIAEVLAADDGFYSFEVECSSYYLLQGSKEGYTPEEVAVETPGQSGNITQDIELEVDGPCHPNDLGCRLALQPIYFDFDKHNIRPDAAIELSKVLEAMKMYPELVIHIESHTDSRGDDDYNMALSDRRAQSTMKWLIDNGIEAKRLTAKGYGESRLVNHCANDVPCTAEEHQLNRRSMFIIQD